SSRRRHTRYKCEWSSDVCYSDLILFLLQPDNLETHSLSLSHTHTHTHTHTRTHTHRMITSIIAIHLSLLLSLFLSPYMSLSPCLAYHERIPSTDRHWLLNSPSP